MRAFRGKAKALPLDCVAAAMLSGKDMLLNARAREALTPLLLACGEYLPVRLDGLDYQWFNCTAMVDIADQDRIEGGRSKYLLEPPECWHSISRWAFHPDRVATAPAIFTVPQWSFYLMCTNVLRRAVEAHDLLADEHRRQGRAPGHAGTTGRPRGRARRAGPGNRVADAVMSLDPRRSQPDRVSCF